MLCVSCVIVFHVKTGVLFHCSTIGDAHHADHSFDCLSQSTNTTKYQHAYKGIISTVRSWWPQWFVVRYNLYIRSMHVSCSMMGQALPTLYNLRFSRRRGDIRDTTALRLTFTADGKLQIVRTIVRAIWVSCLAVENLYVQELCSLL